MKKYNIPSIEILLIADQVIMTSGEQRLNGTQSGDGMSENWLDVFPV